MWGLASGGGEEGKGSILSLLLLSDDGLGWALLLLLLPWLVRAVGVV